MDEAPTTWHYGLVARWWAEFNRDGPEIPYYRTLVEEHGDPALDAGCGTGRILLPLRAAGLDVDGCDLSADMLTLCRDRAAAEGLTPGLYHQALHTLALPRIYRTIFSCGTFGLGGGGGQRALALRRLYAHLAPGGVLALDTGRPAVEATQLDAWIARMASRPAAGWPETGDRRRAADGDELELRTRRVAVDPDARVMTQQIQARLWRGEDVIQEEEHTLTMGLFSTEELLGMLRQTGFRQVDVTDGYVGGIGGGDQPVAAYLARK